MKTPGKLSLLQIGDVHAGHERICDMQLTSQLRTHLLTPAPANINLDYIFIAGDFFDKLLSFNYEYLGVIQAFMFELLQFCARYSIKLRIVEGTPGHDHCQPRHFVHFNAMLTTPCDLVYVETMDVITDDNGISILYVKDEYSTDHNKTYLDATRLMQSKGLDKVHFVLMHGAFEYQLPPVAANKTHNSSLWSPLAEYLIMIGHVHQESYRGNISAAGSFTRHSFGDESPKGYVRATVDLATGNVERQFIVNKEAKVFNTINCSKLDIDKSLERIVNYVTKRQQQLIPGSWLRVVVDANNGLKYGISTLKEKYPYYVWEITTENTKEKAAYEIEHVIDKPFTPITYTPDTLRLKVKEKLEAKYNLDIQHRVMTLLEEFL